MPRSQPSPRPSPAEWTVLIVDPNRSVRDALLGALSTPERVIQTAGTASEALSAVSLCAPDLLVVDVDLAGSAVTGLELLELLRQRGFDGEAIALASPSAEDVAKLTRATNAGARDVVWKPVDPEVLRRTVAGGLHARRPREADVRGVSTDEEEVGGRRLVGSGPVMLEVKRRLAVCASTDVSVLITGETGTGKEVAARSIHWNSGRSEGPFVAVNCGAMASSLLESTLFGHKKGAFTGAVRDHVGHFGRSGEGTIFLDEVGDAPPEVQVRLLRVLQDRRFTSVGGEAEERTTARVIAATNRDLSELVRNASFREDLFHRLDVLRIQMPPLRERVEDLTELVGHLLGRAAAQAGMEVVPPVSDEAMDAMRRRRWPGNVRELEHSLLRAVVAAGPRGVIRPEHLGLEEPAAPRSSTDPGSRQHAAVEADPAAEGRDTIRAGWLGADGRILHWDEGRRRHIEEALGRSGGSVAGAGRLLKMPRSTLQHKIHRLAIDVEDYRRKESR